MTTQDLSKPAAEATKARDNLAHKYHGEEAKISALIRINVEIRCYHPRCLRSFPPVYPLIMFYRAKSSRNTRHKSWSHETEASRFRERSWRIGRIAELDHWRANLVYNHSLGSVTRDLWKSLDAEDACPAVHQETALAKFAGKIANTPGSQEAAGRSKDLGVQISQSKGDSREVWFESRPGHVISVCARFEAIRKRFHGKEKSRLPRSSRSFSLPGLCSADLCTLKAFYVALNPHRRADSALNLPLVWTGSVYRSNEVSVWRIHTHHRDPPRTEVIEFRCGLAKGGGILESEGLWSGESR